MKNRIDLHIHTNFSDGTDNPEKILEIAHNNGLEYISITDHESMEAYKYLENMNKYNLKIINGVEFHTFYKGKEVHVLGYGLDYRDTELDKFLAKIRRERSEVSYKTVENLQSQNVQIDWEDVLKFTRGDVAITKAHIMAALREKKFFDKKIFFDNFNNSGDKYIIYDKNNLEDVVDLINKKRGIAVLAHPGIIFDDSMVEEIVENNKMGIEVYYSYFGEKKEEWIKKYESIAKKYGIISTGGSDYHGFITKSSIGGTFVPDEVIKRVINSL